MDSRGRLRTTKADPDSHGFGLAQMRSVVEKYHGMLDLSHDGERFTVEAALKLP